MKLPDPSPDLVGHGRFSGRFGSGVLVNQPRNAFSRTP